MLSCAQDALLVVLRAASWDQCHHVEWPSLFHMLDGGTAFSRSCQPCACRDKGRHLFSTPERDTVIPCDEHLQINSYIFPGYVNGSQLDSREFLCCSPSHLLHSFALCIPPVLLFSKIISKSKQKKNNLFWIGIQREDFFVQFLLQFFVFTGKNHFKPFFFFFVVLRWEICCWLFPWGLELFLIFVKLRVPNLPLTKMSTSLCRNW